MSTLTDRRMTRTLLLAVVAALLASTPTPSKSEVGLDCEEMEEWHGLFCNNEDPITYCDEGGVCTVSCGLGEVVVPCD